MRVRCEEKRRGEEKRDASETGGRWSRDCTHPTKERREERKGEERRGRE